MSNTIDNTNTVGNAIRRTIWAIIVFGTPTGAILVMLF